MCVCGGGGGGGGGGLSGIQLYLINGMDNGLVYGQGSSKDFYCREEGVIGFANNPLP